MNKFYREFGRISNGVNIKDKLKSGFSLVEILISLSIISVIFSLVIMEVDTLGITKKQRNEFIASQIANNQVENLRAVAFDSLPASGAVTDSLLSQIPSGSGNYTVSDYPNYTGMKELAVTINWTENGSNKSFVVKTLISNNGINQ